MPKVETVLAPCPFCGKKLVHRAGKRVNRFYSGEPTIYQHPVWTSCILDGVEVWAKDLAKWNRRATK